MIQKIIIILINIILLFNISYSQSDNNRLTPKEYAKKFSELAIKEMKRSGVPASITLAQGILESDCGNSRLARKANNHFGIKCHSNWKGRKIIHDDDKKNECFRKYKSVYDSYRDHSDFLKYGQRYQFLFKLKTTDYKGWAKGLKKAGYATEKKYANLLISIIESNKLYIYDSTKKIKKSRQKKDKKKKQKDKQLADIDDYTIDPFKAEVQQKNDIDYIIIKKGDTFYGISKKFDLMLWQLYKYNDLKEGAILNEGQILYLQPKRKKAELPNKYHFVEKGETMYSISQLYGIKLKSLYKKNLMKQGSEPKEGNELWLRKKKKYDDDK
ncbi:MAG: glucosaminidase domain-containing protein [Bacteroidales bacterium]|nr:glucosaminidase domain-containing protein [Bacteroidales bacterium]